MRNENLELKKQLSKQTNSFEKNQTDISLQKKKIKELNSTLKNQNQKINDLNDETYNLREKIMNLKDVINDKKDIIQKQESILAQLDIIKQSDETSNKTSKKEEPQNPTENLIKKPIFLKELKGLVAGIFALQIKLSDQLLSNNSEF